MLVHGPDQSFAAHRDSEKTDDMIDTLVAILAYGFRGRCDHPIAVAGARVPTQAQKGKPTLFLLASRR